MHCVVDSEIPYLDRLFDQVGWSVSRVSAASLSSADLREADALWIRTVTPVDEALLAGSAVRFVGAPAAGTDHLDQAYLKAAGIGYCAAPGCNADAVVDYVLYAMAYAASQGVQTELLTAPKALTVAIMGMGQVGTRLASALSQRGFDPLCYDPPRSARDPHFSGVSSLPWSDIDVLCVHASLTREGPFPSFHYLDSRVLGQLKPGSLIIHAARGDVVAPGAWQANPHLHFIADVFPNEPCIDPADIASALLATPHIAGYSRLAKWRGTAQVMAGFNAYFGLAVPLPVAEAAASGAPFLSARWSQIAGFLSHLDDLSKEFKAKSNSGCAVSEVFRTLRGRYAFRDELSRSLP